MDTNRIRQFLTVAKNQNLRKSAEFLNISHSALSKSLKVLQQDLNKKLFIQKGRNIFLTQEGSEFIPKAEKFLHAEEILFTKNVTTESVVKIATFEVFSTHLLGFYWKDYFPQNELELRELLPGQLENAVAKGISDFAITYSPIAHPDLEFIEITKIKMGIFGKEKFSDYKLNELPFVAPILPTFGIPSEEKGLDGWNEKKHPRKISYRVEMLESAMALSRSGVAVIFSPTFIIDIQNLLVKPKYHLKNLVFNWGPKENKRSVYLIVKKGFVENTNMRILAKLIREKTKENLS